MTDYNKIIDKFGEGRIGDVLEILERDMVRGKIEMDEHMKIEIELLGKWRYVYFSKSLSEILRDEKGYTQAGKFFYSECTGDELTPKAKELFQFLKTL